MKYRIETLTILLLITVYLLTGCNKSKEQTAQPAPVDTPRTIIKTPTNDKTKDPLLGDAGKVPVPPSLPKIAEPEIPDYYKGDPYFYIPSIEYEIHTSTADGDVSYPLLSLQIQQKLDNLGVWSASGQIMTEAGPITQEQRTRMEYDIIAEGFSDLEMAQFIILTGLSDTSVKYAAEYAQKALDENPNDYETLYVWTRVQMDPAKSEQGYRRLVDMNPNSAYLLLMLGRNLVSWENPQTDTKEGITYLKRSAALAPDLKNGLALRVLGDAHLKLKDDDTAIAFYKRAQTIYESADTQNMIELIEKGVLP